MIFYDGDPRQAVQEWIIISPFLYLKSEFLVFIQDGSVYCGVCCMVFMINLVCSQVANSWKEQLQDDGFLLLHIVF